MYITTPSDSKPKSFSTLDGKIGDGEHVLQTWFGLSRIEPSSQQQESVAKSSELQKGKKAMVSVGGLHQFRIDSVCHVCQ